jgi:hypothetical protein
VVFFEHGAGNVAAFNPTQVKAGETAVHDFFYDSIPCEWPKTFIGFNRFLAKVLAATWRAEE